MLTKQALLNNLCKRHILLYRLFLNGYIKNPLFLRYLLRFNKLVNENVEYDYLQKWDRRISRIEDNI